MARWERISARGNVQDRRGSVGAAAGGVGGLGIIGAIIMFVLSGGEDLGPVLDQLNQAQSAPTQQVDAEEFEGEDDYEVFASTVLGSNDETWRAIFRENDLTYQPPTLVLFRQGTQSECGGATSAIGPHYCPLDETIYLDETFFDELQRRFGAEGGDVAEAYVISHEVAHHVQNRVGLMEAVRRQQSGASTGETNELSVALELQADCYAGVWASTLLDEGVFLPGELEEAQDAAAAVGDDRIQERTTGRTDPHSYTHGTSEQRVQWLNTGIETGDPSACDTFEQR